MIARGLGLGQLSLTQGVGVYDWLLNRITSLNSMMLTSTPMFSKDADFVINYNGNTNIVGQNTQELTIAVKSIQLLEHKSTLTEKEE